MNIKQYEEEVKKGCKEIQKQYEIAQTIPLHKDFVPSVNTIINYEILEAKLEAIQKCKEMFKEREENLKQLIKSDILLFEQVSKCLDCEGCKKIIKLRIEELLSQLNGEQK